MKPIKEIEYLVDAFRSLPGVGTKNAKKYAVFLINKDEKFINEFIDRIKIAKDKIHKCNLCNCLSDTLVCSICSDKDREQKICIVSQYEDMEKIEQAKIYKGYYFILNGEIKLTKQNNFNGIDIQKIITMINTLKINEVIIATSFSTNGELTSNYIYSKLNHIHGLSIYRLGFGIPLNANIDYIDNETIKESFLNKKNLFQRKY